MGTNSSTYGEHAATPPASEKEAHTADVLQVDAASDIDAKDLPKGYFLRPYFIGTLIASGLSVSGVRSLLASSI
jgi:hypothetical protein